MKRAALGAALMLTTGCQYVFGLDFADDPKLKTNVVPGPVATQSKTPCAPGEPDCAASPDGGATRGTAGSSHLVTLTSGVDHACAIAADGSVKCFGEDAEGELGNDAITASPTAVPALGLTNVRSVVAGSFHTCALLEAGTVKCWGTNDFGQLGDGTLETRLVPVDVPLLSNVVALAAGQEHTCALIGGGAVKCWGANDEGQLGNDTKTASKVPIDVAIAATSIASGVSARHTCASTATGIMCWGANDHGQLGIGSVAPSLVPREVPGVGPGALAAGSAHTCALTAAGTFCWGDNQLGQLGQLGSLVAESLSPVIVQGVTGATLLGCGSRHCCTATPVGIKCWGASDAGELGAPPLVDVDAIAGSATYSCAHADGKVTCWGSGVWDSDSTTPNLAPPAVIGGLP